MSRADARIFAFKGPRWRHECYGVQTTGFSMTSDAARSITAQAAASINAAMP